MRYRTAAKLTEEDGTVKVSTLMYAMGNKAENINKSLVFNEREKEDEFETVLKKYDDYYCRRPTLYTRGCSFISEPKDQGKRLRHLFVHCTSCQKTVTSVLTEMRTSETD